MSFNQMTADQLGLAEAAALCAEAGIRWFGPWRHKVAELLVLADAARLLRDPELAVARAGIVLELAGVTQ